MLTPSEIQSGDFDHYPHVRNAICAILINVTRSKPVEKLPRMPGAGSRRLCSVALATLSARPMDRRGGTGRT